MRVANEATVAGAMAADWEPVKPTVAQAQEAFQVLLELCRQHPDDAELVNARECARQLRDHAWEEHQAKRRSEV